MYKLIVLIVIVVIALAGYWLSTSHHEAMLQCQELHSFDYCAYELR